MGVAVALFAGALALIATDRVDRMKVALLGAGLLLLTQTIHQDAAVDAIDWNTLGLLVGMMLMVKVTEPTVSTPGWRSGRGSCSAVGRSRWCSRSP